jgi:pimeloyl-ACP methyl ester carboxylesterase
MSKLGIYYAMLFEVNGRILRARDFAPYFEHLAGMDVQIFTRLLERLQEHSVEDRLEHIRVPTLVIAGERDTFTPVWLSHRMQMLIPDSEILVVPGGTHVAPLELPELLALRLERFFDERIRPGLRRRRGAPGVRRLQHDKGATRTPTSAAR